MRENSGRRLYGMWGASGEMKDVQDWPEQEKFIQLFLPSRFLPRDSARIWLGLGLLCSETSKTGEKLSRVAGAGCPLPDEQRGARCLPAAGHQRGPRQIH